MIDIKGNINSRLWPGSWEISREHTNDPNKEAIQILFQNVDYNKRAALIELSDKLINENLNWLKPISQSLHEWLIDLTLFRECFENLKDVSWLDGKMKVSPQHIRGGQDYFSSIKIMLSPFELISYNSLEEPAELTSFIEAFKLDHPDPQKCAFLMMKYESTSSHKKITEVIKKFGEKYGIKVLRADDKSYSPDLLPNIRTYMHGCGFGIIVFERLTKNDFNPNVSLEVGYMMALEKPVCLLKDSTLPALPTDIIGRLYEEFDTQHPEKTIPAALEKWMRNKKLIK
jgi:hypothetical protein